MTDGYQEVIGTFKPGPRPSVPPPPPPLTVGSRTDPHTAALDNLADAIRELAQALRQTFTPPEPPATNESPGPAKGLNTQIRTTPDHRNPNARSNLGFAPVKAGGIDG